MKFNFLNGEITNIHSAAFILGAAGLLSRLLGVLRDRLLAGQFGAGRELDIYYAAFQIPDFMALVFILGSGSAAILPIFQDVLSSDRAEAHKLISHLVTLFLLGAIVVAAGVFVFVPSLMFIIAPGFSESEQNLTILLTRIMLISPILLGLSSILSAVLQSYQRFFAFALAPILYNAGIILGILIFTPIWGLAGLAVGVIIGALLHFLVQFAPTLSLGFAQHVKPHILRDSFTVFFRGPVTQVLKLSFPRFVSLSITRITSVVLVAIASTLAPGSISIYKLADNLFSVPVGVFGVSYAIALFPKIHQAYLKKNGSLFCQEMFMGIRTILFWIIPFSILFLVLRAHIVRATLGAGVFSWEDTRLTAAVLGVLVLAMWAEGLGSLLIKGFYALESTWVPLFINVATSVLGIILAVLLTQALAAGGEFSNFATSVFRIKDLPNPEVLGLAAGFTIGLAVNIFCLYRALLKLTAEKFGVLELFPYGALGKIILASVLAGIAAYGVRVSFSETLPLITFARVLGQGAIAGGAGFLVYFLSLYFMKSEDMEAVARTVRRRIFKLGLLPRVWDSESITHL